MKAVFLIFILGGFMSCGKKHSEKKSSHTFSLETEMTPEEQRMIDSWVERNQLTEKEVLSDLLKLKKYEEEVLRKFDTQVDVRCIEGICEITKKEKK